MPERLRSLLPLLILGLSSGMPAAGAAPRPSAETLYTGGTILTMAGEQPGTVEPLASAPRSAATKVVDLQGKTLLPGFIDTHGHFIYFGKNLIDADLFGAGSIPEIVRRMREQATKVGPTSGSWASASVPAIWSATRAWPNWMRCRPIGR
jgi:hypothetical protein